MDTQAGGVDGSIEMLDAEIASAPTAGSRVAVAAVNLLASWVRAKEANDSMTLITSAWDYGEFLVIAGGE